MGKVLFCPQHGNSFHHVFSNKKTACIDCIDYIFKEETKNAAIIAGIVKNAIPENEYRDLLTNAQRAKAMVLSEDEDLGILGLIACKIARERSDLGTVLDRIKAKGSFYTEEDKRP